MQLGRELKHCAWQCNSRQPQQALCRKALRSCEQQKLLLGKNSIPPHSGDSYKADPNKADPYKAASPAPYHGEHGLYCRSWHLSVQSKNFAFESNSISLYRRKQHLQEDA